MPVVVVVDAQLLPRTPFTTSHYQKVGGLPLIKVPIFYST